MGQYQAHQHMCDRSPLKGRISIKLEKGEGRAGCEVRESGDTLLRFMPRQDLCHESNCVPQNPTLKSQPLATCL